MNPTQAVVAMLRDHFDEWAESGHNDWGPDFELENIVMADVMEHMAPLLDIADAVNDWHDPLHNPNYMCPLCAALGRLTKEEATP